MSTLLEITSNYKPSIGFQQFLLEINLFDDDGN